MPLILKFTMPMPNSSSSTERRIYGLDTMSLPLGRNPSWIPIQLFFRLLVLRISDLKRSGGQVSGAYLQDGIIISLPHSAQVWVCTLKGIISLREGLDLVRLHLQITISVYQYCMVMWLLSWEGNFCLIT